MADHQDNGEQMQHDDNGQDMYDSGDHQNGNSSESSGRDDDR
jgi:hypothetical protein